MLEDGQVEQAALRLGGDVIGPLVRVNQQEGFVEGGHDVIDLVPRGLRPVFDLGLLFGDAGLFGPQDILGDGVAVVELDELLLLGGQLAQAAGVTLTLGTGDQGSFFDGRADGFADALAFLNGEPIVGVDSLEPVFDELEADVAGAAGSAGRDAAEAGVVLVVVAVPVAMAAVAVAFAAVPADNLSGQVMVVLAAAAAARAVAREDGLDAVEGLLVDEAIVAALLLDAAMGDDAEVVVVTQHPVDRADGQRLRWPGRRRARTQAGLVEDLGDGADGVLAGGGEIESHADQGCALGVNRDAGDLAVLDRLFDVEVAQAGGADRPAVLVLAIESKLDLLAVVTGAEGVDAAHDRELEHSFGRVVDAFLGRFELGTVGGDLAQQPEGVEFVAGAAAEVVEDDVVRLQLGQFAEHQLQLGAVAGGGGFAGLDVLADDGRAEAFGVAGADVALGGQRVAFAVDRGVDLSDRRDAQVEDGGLRRLRRGGCGRTPFLGPPDVRVRWM